MKNSEHVLKILFLLYLIAFLSASSLAQRSGQGRIDVSTRIIVTRIDVRIISLRAPVMQELPKIEMTQPLSTIETSVPIEHSSVPMLAASPPPGPPHRHVHGHHHHHAHCHTESRIDRDGIPYSARRCR